MELKSTDKSTPNLLPGSCLICKAQVWIMPGGMDANGRVLSFDLLKDHTGSMLMVHDCHEDDEDGFYFDDWDYDPAED